MSDGTSHYDRSGAPAEPLPPEGALLDLHGTPHRVLLYVRRRVLLIALGSHHVWLEKDRSGTLQAPTKDALRRMLRSGVARAHQGVANDVSPTEKLQFTIDLLDANKVKQGDKAIWLFLRTHWTADVIERFGPHDDPRMIRQWRAKLHAATEKQVREATR